MFFFLMRRRPPRSTRTDTLFPYTTLCRSAGPGGAAIVDSAEHTWPESLDVMGWRIDDVGFGLELRRDLPGFLADRLRPVVEGFLGRHGLSITDRSEEHTSELQSLMRISYAVFRLKKKK